MPPAERRRRTRAAQAARPSPEPHPQPYTSTHLRPHPNPNPNPDPKPDAANPNPNPSPDLSPDPTPNPCPLTRRRCARGSACATSPRAPMRCTPSSRGRGVNTGGASYFFSECNCRVQSQMEPKQTPRRSFGPPFLPARPGGVWRLPPRLQPSPTAHRWTLRWTLSPRC